MMLSPENIFRLNEAKSFNVGDMVWIHFPITEDLTTCRVKQLGQNKVLLEMTEDNDLFGCPDFWFARLNIIGKSPN